MNIRFRNSSFFSPWWMMVALLTAVVLTPAWLGGCQESQRRDMRSSGGSRIKAIAVVNNEPVALEDFLDRYKLFLTRWDRFIKNDVKKKQEIKELVLNEMIDEKLLDQEARRRGIQVSPEEVKQRMAALTTPWGETELEQTALRSSIDFESWQEALMRRVVHEKLIQKEVVARIQITSRELRDYYQRNKNSFIQSEQVHVRHIAVSSRNDYNRVQNSLRQNEDFVKLVRKYSITPDREADGDLGYVERGVLPVEFDQAIFAMQKIGSISPANPPVKTQIGYHIFRLEGRKARAQLTFEQAIPQIRKTMVALKQPEAYQNWVKTLRDRSTIHIDQKLLQAELG